jgi:hypothetical protein
VVVVNKLTLVKLELVQFMAVLAAVLVVLSTVLLQVLAVLAVQTSMAL